jgi:hypothetical protein
MGDDAPRFRPAFRREVARDRDEVGKRVGLAPELAVLVPMPAFVGPAAHVGDGVNEAAIDQRKAVGAEGGGKRRPIRPVTVK